MATESKNNNNNLSSFDYGKLGNDYGVSLKFDLCANDYVNKQLENDLITENISNTTWKFHFHDLFQTSSPKLHNGKYCWNFEKAYLYSMNQKYDELQSVTLNDNYTYCILISWKEISNQNDDNNNKQNPIIVNPNTVNIQNHSIQQSITKSHKKIHQWRIPLRARIIQQQQQQNDNDYDSNHGQNTNKLYTKSQKAFDKIRRTSISSTQHKFVDWVTLKSSTTSRLSSIGLLPSIFYIL